MEKKNDIRIMSTCIFICKSCHLACASLPDSWMEPYRGKKPNPLPPDFKPYTENKQLVIYFNSNKTWNFQNLYSNIIGEMKGSNIHFPLCDSCMKRIISSNFCKISLSQSLRTFSFDIQRLKSSDLNVKSFNEDVIYHIQRLHVENRDFQQAKKIAVYQKVAPFISQKAHFLLNENKAQSNRHPPVLKTHSPKTNSIFKSCSLHTIFSFSFNRHYATINGFRLGSLTPNVVPRKEVDTGLFFLCQFVVYIGKLAGLKISHIRTKIFMEVKIEDQGFTEVHFPSAKSKQKKYDTFNSCMSTFFAVCSSIFANPCINESNRRPPFQINLAAKKIDDIPFKFSKKDPSKWTDAMRLLIIDFKTIQYSALENFINSTDS